MRIKMIFQSFFVLLLVIGALFSLSGCSDDKEKAELASYHWETVAVSSEEFHLPDNYMNQHELYLLVTRDILESDYDLSKVTLGDEPITLVDSSFNLPGPGHKALFLVGKFELNDKSSSGVLTAPEINKTGDVAIGYKVKQ